MPIQPFIFVGVGGTGGKTLGVIHKMLGDALTRVGWNESWPEGWQFVHIDVPSDPDANAGKDANPYGLPRTSYVPLTTSRSTYVGFHDGISQELQQSAPNAVERYLAWECWRPEPATAVRVEIPNGAGQYRAIGRVCVIKSLRQVDQALRRAFDAATAAPAAPQLRRVQALIESKPPSVGDTKPVIFVVGSVSGGSGSGMFLDVCDVLRAQGHREINGVLFTPEVFEDPNGEIEPGVAPNTFLALTEISNAMWTHAQADAPLSRDRLFGRAGVSYPVGHGGPSTVFLVGRRNRSVTFNSADDVYKIVGRSLGELAIDEALTTAVVNYDIANGNAIASGAADSLNLSPPGEARDVAPFRALGFSRLTVGRDVFSRYATDRLLRRVALRLLDGHLERRRPNDPSSDEELKQAVVKEMWPPFLRDTELDELGKQNDISDRLDPLDEADVSQAIAGIVRKLRDNIEAGAHRGNVNQADARARAREEVGAACEPGSEFGHVAVAAITRLALKLQETVQTRLQDVFLRNAAAHGLPVTIELVDKLIDRSREGVEDLGRDRSTNARKISETLDALSSPKAGTPSRFALDSTEDMDGVTDDAVRVLRRHVRSLYLELAEDFLDDLRINLLEPWRRALSDADGLLRLELRPQVGRSPLKLWPGDEGVPDYLRPSKVEFLLDPVDTFPEQFIDVIERSVSGVKEEASVVLATEQIASATDLGIRSTARPIAVVNQVWVPRAKEARPVGQNRAAAKISINLSLADLESRTHAWLTDQEKFIGQFLRHSLGDYLTDPLTPAPELKQRQDRLVGHFEQMIKSSLPLIALDSSMTNLIHGHDVPDYNLHVSDLNVPDQLTEIRRRINEAAVALLRSDQTVSFTNDPRSDATMMTLLAKPYHIVEVASIMEPISKQWAKGGNAHDMWQYRLARPLSEWVPLGQEACRALITGWFTARLLGTAQNGSTRAEVTVTVEGRDYQIPHRVVRPASPREPIGMLMEALPAAFLECFNQKSLSGIKAYQHLIALGASIEDEQNAFVDWLASPADIPSASAASGTGLASRPEAAAAQVALWRKGFEAIPNKFHDVHKAQKHPTYEVFTDALIALDRLDAAIAAHTVEEVPLG